MKREIIHNISNRPRRQAQQRTLPSPAVASGIPPGKEYMPMGQMAYLKMTFISKNRWHTWSFASVSIPSSQLLGPGLTTSDLVPTKRTFLLPDCRKR